MSARLATLAVVGLIAGTPATAEPIDVTRLQAGDTIRIQYRSSGCFHDETRTITIVQAETAIASVSPGPPESPNGPRGFHQLSATDLTRLQNLLHFYRAQEAGGCTTEDRIEIAFISNGVTKNSEVYVDATCAASGSPEVLDLWSLVRRASGLPDSSEPIPLYPVEEGGSSSGRVSVEESVE